MSASMDEKSQFAQRLADSMRAAGYEARSNVLEKNFNALYWGRSITYQAARRWLKGWSIPEQDKLQVLADWLNVAPHWLRYGGQPRYAVAEPRAMTWPANLKPNDREALEAYLALPAARRRLVRELIQALTSNR